MMVQGMKVALYRQRRHLAGALLLGLIVLLLLAPGLFLITSYRLSMARYAFYMAALVATWSLLAGVAGVFSFGHAAIAGLAGYAGAIFGKELSASHHLLGNVGVSVVFGMVFAWVVGTLLGLLLLRLRAAYLALFTIAFSEIARLIVVAETDLTGGRMSLMVDQIPGSDLTHYYLILAALLFVLAVVYWLVLSRIGLFLRAMREDYDAAAAAGVNVTWFKVLVFSVTSALVGLVASLYFHTIPRMVPENLDLLVMSLIIAYAVVGGLESPLAGALAALTMTFVLEGLRRIDLGPIHIQPGVWRFAAFGVLLVITLRVARNGLLMPLLEFFVGRTERLRETVAGRELPAARDEETPTEIDGVPAVAAQGRGNRGTVDLRVEDLRMSFGGNRVLEGVDLVLTEPVICGLIGPNGAGKTTFTNILTGIYEPTGGAVYMNGERVDGLPPYEIARRGLGRTFQVTRAFRRLTVLENLLVPCLAVDRAVTRRVATEQAMQALRLVRMEHLAHEYGRALSGGQRKLLELARLLMLDPHLMILDEPFAGVHPRLKETIYDFVKRLREAGKAFIVIEHDMEAIFSISERLVVLAGGTLIADGEPGVVKRDPAVIEAYLGTDEEEEDGGAPGTAWDAGARSDGRVRGS